MRHIWTTLAQDAARVAAWIDTRTPASIPHWIWAALLIILALIVGRLGGRVLAGIMQLALLLAALLVGWQMVRQPLRASSPPACSAHSSCGAGPRTGIQGSASL